MSDIEWTGLTLDDDAESIAIAIKWDAEHAGRVAHDLLVTGRLGAATLAIELLAYPLAVLLAAGGKPA